MDAANPEKRWPTLGDVVAELELLSHHKGNLDGDAVGSAARLIRLPRYSLQPERTIANELLAGDIRTAVSRVSDGDHDRARAELLLSIRAPGTNVTWRRQQFERLLPKGEPGSVRIWRERFVLAQVAYELLQLGLEPYYSGPDSLLLRPTGFRFLTGITDVYIEDDTPWKRRTVYTWEIEAVRNGVRTFELPMLPEGQRYLGPPVVLSEAEGHKWIGEVPLIGSGPDGPVLWYVYLGRALDKDEPTTVRVQVETDQLKHDADQMVDMRANRTTPHLALRVHVSADLVSRYERVTHPSLEAVVNQPHIEACLRQPDEPLIFEPDVHERHRYELHWHYSVS